MTHSPQHYFGTDGIRGCFGKGIITPEFFQQLGWAAGRIFLENAPPSEVAPFVFIARDTRESGEQLQAALVAGLTAAGMDCYLLGVAPTPVVAYLTKHKAATAGLVISASHNDYFDNGLKFFSAAGFKLTDEVELAIEAKLAAGDFTAQAMIGEVQSSDDLSQLYLDHCHSLLNKPRQFAKLKLVLDCANGATYDIAPRLFSSFGAQVHTINALPDGVNINYACGSTKPEQLAQAVLAEKADIGIAFDGDGDRVIMVDHEGEVVDGDEILFVIAKRALAKGDFHSGIVGTVMTNMGLELACADLGVPFMRTKVGDRYVIEALNERNWTLGGETSGHIICMDATTTGDGMIAALKVLLAVTTSGQTLHELKQGMQKMPQSLVNVPAQNSSHLMSLPEVQRAVDSAQTRLNGHGRVLLRPSGTEPVIRVMAEGKDPALIKALALDIASVIVSAESH